MTKINLNIQSKAETRQQFHAINLLHVTTFRAGSRINCIRAPEKYFYNIREIRSIAKRESTRAALQGYSKWKHRGT